MKIKMNMKTLMLTISAVFLMQSSAFASGAASDGQLKALSAMGRLNAIALQCRYMPQVQRIKRELVLNLPKQRALGDWFEQKTNESFLNFMQNNTGCPAVLDFDQELQQTIDQLETEFKK